jgi:ribosome maturation factor RimP
LVTREHIETLAAQHLQGTSLFVTAVKVSPENHIGVFIDGDQGVTIKDCVELSRAIEASLDREKEDFSLDVSSHGATSPLLMPRQYRRHIGRDLEVKLQNGEKTEGKLVESDDKGFVLVYEVREPKPLGKGKVTVEKRQPVAYGEVKEARIKLKY